jgi:DNA helicase IV
MAGASVAKLDVAHRSTAPIMAVANALVADSVSGGRLGVRPAMAIIPQEEVLARVADLARQAYEQNPAGHTCVVLRKPSLAKEFFSRLQARLSDLPAPVRLGHNKDFVFGAGVTVTNMLQVKGLEFDTVILLDPTDMNYPDTKEGRRHLYTMVTRAKDALHFVSAEPPGILVQQAIDAGTVDLVDETEVKAVRFVAEDDEPF